MLQLLAPEELGYNFDTLLKLLRGIPKAIEPARHKSKVLLIGATGAGKSTLLNYLTGVRYKTSYNGLVLNADKLSGDEVTATGGTFESQTLYPTVINITNKLYSFCDLAGLQENRGSEYAICASSSIRMLSLVPGGIQTILVVLDRPSFGSARANSFKDTAIKLAKMLQFNPKLLSNVYYVLTKLPPKRKFTGIEFIDSIFYCIKDLLWGKPFTISIESIIADGINVMLKPLQQKSKSRNFSDDNKALLFMLEHMNQNMDHIILGDITDHGESRISILQQIEQATPKPEILFDFNTHVDTHQEFITKLEEVSMYYLALRNQLKSHKEKLSILSVEKVLAERKLDSIRIDITKQIQIIKNVNLKIKTTEAEIKRFDSTITSNAKPCCNNANCHIKVKRLLDNDALRKSSLNLEKELAASRVELEKQNKILEQLQSFAQKHTVSIADKQKQSGILLKENSDTDQILKDNLKQFTEIRWVINILQLNSNKNIQEFSSAFDNHTTQSIQPPLNATAQNELTSNGTKLLTKHAAPKLCI